MKKQIQNKFNAVWLSHSSISDFLKCPRLYYLKNIWKNQNGCKVNIVSPHMSLGSAVHQVVEPLANLKVQERVAMFTTPIQILEKYETIWKKYSGKIGGFEDIETETFFKERGKKMLENVFGNPGPLIKKTVKFYTGDFIPNIYLSESDNIILCGLVDWVEYCENDDTLKVIDFKTGKNDEKEESFQLPIYKLLVESLQKRKVSSGAYWYLDRDRFPKSVELIDEDVEEIKKKILGIGLEIKKRKGGIVHDIEENFTCNNPGSCYECRDFELIKNQDLNPEKLEYLGQGEYKQDLYFIKK